MPVSHHLSTSHFKTCLAHGRGWKTSAGQTHDHSFGTTRPTKMAHRPKYHQLLLLGLKIPQTQPTTLPSPIPGAAVQILRKTARDEGTNVSSWCSSGSDDSQTAGRGSCSLAAGTAPLGEAAGAHQRLRAAQRPGPSDGCCLAGCEPEKRSSPRDAAARRPGCLRQEEAALRSRSENKGTGGPEVSTRSELVIVSDHYDA